MTLYRYINKWGISHAHVPACERPRCHRVCHKIQGGGLFFFFFFSKDGQIHEPIDV